jgi:dTDP-4-dehydrorhamnose reductase
VAARGSSDGRALGGVGVKVLVLGGSGMLGHRVAGVLSDSGHEVAVTVMDGFGPDAVVNCIGIVKQKDEAKAAVPSIEVNSLFPHQVAALCTRAGARMVHVSTDCVFSGSRGRYTEDDVPDATDLYGRSKLLGEVTGVAGAVTVRTSIIGWELRNPTGLLEWFALQQGDSCVGYRRAVFSGLSTPELARVIEGLLGDWRDIEGLWHVSAEPIDKLTLLTMVRDALGWDVTLDPTDEPVIDRSLDSTRFREATGWTPPSWDAMVAELAAERSGHEG